MAQDSEEIKIQRLLLTESVWQTRYLSAILEQQAEILARMKGLSDPEGVARQIEIDAQNAAEAELKSIRLSYGVKAD